MGYDLSMNLGDGVPKPIVIGAETSTSPSHLNITIKHRVEEGGDIDLSINKTLDVWMAAKGTVGSDKDKVDAIDRSTGHRKFIPLRLSTEEDVIEPLLYIRVDELQQRLGLPDAYFDYAMELCENEETEFDVANRTNIVLTGLITMDTANKRTRSTLMAKLSKPIDAQVKTEADLLLGKLPRNVPREKTSLKEDEWEDYEGARMSPSTTLSMGTGRDHWRKAEQFISNLAQSKQPLGLDEFRKINTLLRGDCEGSGKLRNNPVNQEVQWGSTGLAYLSATFVEEEVSSYLNWLSEQLDLCDQGKANPIEVAALACQRCVSIHPFVDGNGRTSRLIMDYVFKRYELFPPVIPSDKNLAAFGEQYALMQPASHTAMLNEEVEEESVSSSEAVRTVTEATKSTYESLGLLDS